MTPALLISLIVITLVIASGAIALLVLNILQFSAYAKATRAPRRGMAPWIVSIVACFVGPFVLVVAPVSLIWGAIVLVQGRRRPGAQAERIPARLAVINSSAVLLGMASFFAWTLAFRQATHH